MRGHFISLPSAARAATMTGPAGTARPPEMERRPPQLSGELGTSFLPFIKDLSTDSVRTESGDNGAPGLAPERVARGDASFRAKGYNQAWPSAPPGCSWPP